MMLAHMLVVFEMFLHIDRLLGQVVQQFGVWTYVILFLVLFLETGIVIAPFLPGDSLLFAAGALAGLGLLYLPLLLLVLVIAAILGDTVNYWIGRELGEKILKHPWAGRSIKPSHLARTRQFYEQHGSKMIFLARFVPIIRTVAPFVAGLSTMHYRTFFFFNVFGGIVWVGVFTLGGYFFGNIKLVQQNFTLIILAIIFVSLLPFFVELLRAREKNGNRVKLTKD